MQVDWNAKFLEVFSELLRLALVGLFRCSRAVPYSLGSAWWRV
jgi:hypothetical protein